MMGHTDYDERISRSSNPGAAIPLGNTLPLTNGERGCLYATSGVSSPLTASPSSTCHGTADSHTHLDFGNPTEHSKYSQPAARDNLRLQNIRKVKVNIWAMPLVIFGIAGCLTAFGMILIEVIG
jgi:hypothetical protein